MGKTASFYGGDVTGWVKVHGGGSRAVYFLSGFYCKEERGHVRFLLCAGEQLLPPGIILELSSSMTAKNRGPPFTLDGFRFHFR